MHPQPVFEKERDVLRLRNTTVIITGGDSGIGKAVAIDFAKEGSDVVISYHEDDEDARSTAARIESIGQQCLLIPGDISKPAHCKKIIERTLKQIGKLDVLLEDNRNMRALLQERDYAVTYREFSGGHNYTAWRNDLWHGLEALFSYHIK